ncbi:restriction endonuclease, partial [Klebsiella quasivariicola]|uniref:restriction endonuclease n=2 Tax=Klebsiella quasivariicola TaxID=2026240 RepID=UPI002556891A
MKGIGTVLKAGYLKLDHSMKAYSIHKENSLLFTGHFADLDPHGWGSLYEKFTGQIFEAEGYEVEYLGLTAGFNDGGIDLILRKGNDTIFVQCKHSFKEGANKRGNSSRLTQSFHFFMFEPI